MMKKTTTNMTFRRFLCAVGFVAIVGWMAGCDTTDEVGDSGSGSDASVSGNDGSAADGSGADAATLPEGVVSFHAADETAEVTFETGEEAYLVVPYSVATEAASGLAFTITVEGPENTSGTTTHALTQPVRPDWRSQVSPTLLARWQGRLAAEKWRRQLAEDVATKQLLSTQPRFIAGEDCVKSADCAATEVCHAGKCATEVQLNTSVFSDDAETINTTVAKKGTHVAILVDNDVPTIPDADLQDLVDTFDQKIYPRNVALFGNPPLRDGEGDGAVLSTDRNSDGLVWIVMTEHIADKQETVGLFIPVDFVPSSGDGADSRSNEADILFIVPPSDTVNLAAINTTIAHEMQHLLNFAVKVYRPQANDSTGALASLWLDEGQSHFAEDACGFGAENVSLLSSELLTSFNETSMIPESDENGPIDSLAMRAMAMTFVRYLFEQKGGVTYESDGTITDNGGAQWLASLHTTDAQGRAAIEQTYGNFVDAFDRWIATVALDNRGVTDSPLLNYQAKITDPQAPGNLIGLRLRGTFKNEEDEDIELQGPIEQEDPLTVGDTEGAISSTTGDFFPLKGFEQSVTVTVKSEESGFRFAVIKLK